MFHQGSRGGPFQMVYIFGASSLHYALGRNIRERRQLPEVITKSGYNLHPQAQDS